MALLKGVCHSVLLSGNLKKTNELKLRLPFEDILSNLWQISLNEIAISYKGTANILCGISCNFVNDITYNKVNQITNYSPILWQILFKGKNLEKQINRLEKSWFYLTSAKDELVLTFHLFSEGVVSDKPLNLDCDVFATLLLQRVK